MTALADLESLPYVGYVYGYPHKTAYRPFDRGLELQDVWDDEDRTSLFLYLHVPFCEMRCGFCNLFTQTRARQELSDAYLAALRRQASRLRESLGDARFARLAVGGGTPTYLSVAQLEEFLDIVVEELDADPARLPVSVEVSPATAELDKLDLLRRFGVDRVSLGVQTFDEAESKRLGRFQRTGDVEGSLDRIRETGFETLNIDLIYGGRNQTVSGWLESLSSALRYRPEEIYLYPLYVRPLTGLGRRQELWEDERSTAYREGRDLLLDSGYEQISMRMFRASHAPTATGPVYCCQTDGMIGLGCGARSYTRRVHYSNEYAVGAVGVSEIIADFVSRTRADFATADFGYELDGEDQRRRFVLMSLLQCDGLDRLAYERCFGTDAVDDLGELADLESRGLAIVSEDRVRLTERGIELSDAIGPAFYSAKVRRRMEGYEWR